MINLFERKAIILEAPGDPNQPPVNPPAPKTADPGLDQIDKAASKANGVPNDTPPSTDAPADGGELDPGMGDLGQDMSVDNEAKQKDREIFDSLSTDEQRVKNTKLKEQFIDLYEHIDQISKKFDAIGHEYEDYSSAIKKSLDILFNLKSMISTYLLNLFDSKTYIENDIMFNRYLSVLNGLNIATEEIKKENEDKINQSKDLKDGKLDGTSDESIESTE